MDARFQTTRRLFPDVRLHLSGSGICVDFGPQTVLYQNRSGQGSPTLQDPLQDPLAEQVPEPVATGRRIFRRERPDTFSSHNLIPLANLACEVEARRVRITAALDACRRQTARAKRRLKVGHALASVLPPARLSVDDWETTLASLTRTEANLQARLDATVLDFDFIINAEMRADYLALADAFRAITGAESIWHEVPGAEHGEKTPVRFTVEPLPLFRSDLPALRLGEVKGAALFLLPGLLVLHRPGVEVALVEMKDLTLEFSPRTLVGTKEPQAEAGEIEIASTSGFKERFLVSDWPALKVFQERMTAFQAAVAREKARAGRDCEAVPYVDIPDLEVPALPESRWDWRWEIPWPMPSARVLKLSGVAAAVCAWMFVVAGIVTQFSPSGSQAPAVQVAAVEPAAVSQPTPPAAPAPSPVAASPVEVSPIEMSPVEATPAPPEAAMPVVEPAPPAVVAPAEVTPSAPASPFIVANTGREGAAAPDAPKPARTEPILVMNKAREGASPDVPKPAPAAPILVMNKAREGASPDVPKPAPAAPILVMNKAREGASPDVEAPPAVVAAAEAAPEPAKPAVGAVLPMLAPADDTPAPPTSEIPLAAAPSVPEPAPVAVASATVLPPKSVTRADVVSQHRRTAAAARSPESLAAAMPELETAAGPFAGPVHGAPPRSSDQSIPKTGDPLVDQVLASLAAADPTRVSRPASRTEQNTMSDVQPASYHVLTEEEIAHLQNRLYALGYYYGRADGQLNDATIRAFNAWRSETSRPLVQTVDEADYSTFITAISR